MEEIKVGEYVRTKEGFIAKCKEIDEDKEYYEFDKCVDFEYGDSYYSLCDYELFKIVKHSPNIIDLIEEGDYVNGKLVINVVQFSDEICSCFKQVLVNRDKSCTLPPLRITENDIKSIVTKEQMKSIEYIVKE